MGLGENYVAQLHILSNTEVIVGLREGESLQAGRGTSNDIVIDDPSASRIHATFSSTLTGVTVTDLSSTNGTFVNGERVPFICALCNGDVVTIGSTKITVELRTRLNTTSLMSSRSMTVDLEQVQVTILIVSVRGFPHFREVIPLNEILGMLHSWQAGLYRAVQSSQGTVDKVIQHNLVAVWAGRDKEAKAAGAIAAAQEILEFSKSPALTAAWPHRDRHPWDVLALLHSGKGIRPKLRGAADADRNMAAVLGDPFSETFELMGFVEKTLPPNGSMLVISQDTLQLAPGALKLRESGQAVFTHKNIELKTFA